jgi:hypothetical protein
MILSSADEAEHYAKRVTAATEGRQSAIANWAKFLDVLRTAAFLSSMLPDRNRTRARPSTARLEFKLIHIFQKVPAPRV